MGNLKSYPTRCMGDGGSSKRTDHLVRVFGAKINMNREIMGLVVTARIKKGTISTLEK